MAAEMMISLDVERVGSQYYLMMKQGETDRMIKITLCEGEKPYSIETGSTIVFTAKKADGNIIFNNCYMVEEAVVYQVTEQTTAALGEMACELRVYSAEGMLLISPRFTINIVAAVVTDSEAAESITEVNTLTGLIHEAVALIADVEGKLENGDFIPVFEIGTVQTLPAGSNATVTITGTSTSPVLNFGIPQGDEGTAEGLVPDAELSLGSTKPVQNKTVTAALNSKVDKVEGKGLSSNDYTTEDKTALGNKVDKVTGKELSTNDFTDAYKAKLDGIAENANNYSLPDGGVSTAKLANEAVTTGKIADNAVTAAKTSGIATLDSDNKVTASQASAALTEETSAFTLSLSQGGKLIRANSASAITVTVPAGTAAAFPVGTEIELCRMGAGAVTFAAGDGVTIHSLDGALSISGQYGCASLKKLEENTWLLAGALE